MTILTGSSWIAVVCRGDDFWAASFVVLWTAGKIFEIIIKYRQTEKKIIQFWLAIAYSNNWRLKSIDNQVFDEIQVILLLLVSPHRCISFFSDRLPTLYLLSLYHATITNTLLRLILYVWTLNMFRL